MVKKKVFFKKGNLPEYIYFGHTMSKWRVLLFMEITIPWVGVSLERWFITRSRKRKREMEIMGMKKIWLTKDKWRDRDWRLTMDVLRQEWLTVTNQEYFWFELTILYTILNINIGFGDLIFKATRKSNRYKATINFTRNGDRFESMTWVTSIQHRRYFQIACGNTI